MSWRQRLAELVIAGGLTAAAGCGSSIPGGSCNANPDPCCSDSSSAACHSKEACQAHPTDACCADGNNRFLVAACSRDGGLADGG